MTEDLIAPHDDDRFAREVLAPGERVLFITHRHFLAVLRPLALSALAGIGGGAALVALREVEIARLILAPWCVGALLMLGYQWLAWRRDTVRVTDLRLYRSRGIFNKEFFSDELRGITNVELDLPMLGRLFGFGTVRVYTASQESSRRDFTMVCRARQLQKAIADAKARADDGSVEQLAELLERHQQKRSGERWPRRNGPRVEPEEPTATDAA